MSWPINFNITTQFVGKSGALPILLPWGTDGLLPGIIVKTVRASQMISEVQIEQGSGLTVSDVLINDGDEIEFTCVDDRAYSWPVAGGVVTFLNPQPNGASATSENYQVINNNYTVARKVEGERTVLAKKYSLIVPVQM